MGLPLAQAHPTKIHFTVLIFTDHVIAATVFLDGNITLGALLRVRSYPVGSLRIIVTLFDPFFQKVTFDWIVPVFPAREAKRVRTLTRHRPTLDVLHLYRIVTVWRRTPSKQSIALETHMNFNK